MVAKTEQEIAVIDGRVIRTGITGGWTWAKPGKAAPIIHSTGLAVRCNTWQPEDAKIYSLSEITELFAGEAEVAADATAERTMHFCIRCFTSKNPDDVKDPEEEALKPRNAICPTCHMEKDNSGNCACTIGTAKEIKVVPMTKAPQGSTTPARAASRADAASRNNAKTKVAAANRRRATAASK
jgi:hypothetical protein